MQKEMNARDSSCLTALQGTLMWTPQVREDVGLRSCQNFVLESASEWIILPDIEELRFKVVGFQHHGRCWYHHILTSTVIVEERGSRDFSWHD